MPLVVDTIADEAMDAYRSWPERLYVIDGDGRIAYRGGKGPYFFSPDRLAAFLRGFLDGQEGAR